MADNKQRLKHCIIINFALLCLIIVIIMIMKEPNDKYLSISVNCSMSMN